MRSLNNDRNEMSLSTEDILDNGDMNLFEKIRTSNISNYNKKYFFIGLLYLLFVFKPNSVFAGVACAGSTDATADFSVDNTAPVVDENVTFTNQSQDENQWNWNFGADANPPSAVNVEGPHTVSYSAPGLKTVTLTVQASDGNGNGDTETNYIQVYETYYSTAGGNPSNTGSWNTQRDGTGSAPGNTNGDCMLFVIQNGHGMTTTGAWTLGDYSGIQVEDGTLTENNTITLQANGSLQIDDAGTLNHNINSTNIFSGTETFSNASTFNYGFAGAQDVEGTTYGNLTISGGNTKTIQGDVNINGDLTLSNGNLAINGANNISVAGDILGAPFSNTNMIACNGTGSFVKETTDGSGLDIIYPVGEGANYTPMEITSITASGTGSVSVNVIASVAVGPPAANATDLGRYWDVASTGISITSANVSFNYLDPNDVNGVEADYEAALFTGSNWASPNGKSINTTTNTISSSATSTLTGQWTAREKTITYYSYQSGNWGTATTWTTDPSGTLSTNPAVPGSGDRAVILNGRTVYTTSNGLNAFSLDIKEGGKLDLRTTTGHDLGTVTGKGWLRLQSGNFPSGSFGSFTSADGGTVEYYNTTNFNLIHSTYNNLIFNLSATGTTTTILNDLTVNGDLSINTGTFRINNNSATTRLDLTTMGDVLIGTNGRVTVGTGSIGTGANDAHRFIIKGNFTNNGEARFTNLTAPGYVTYVDDRVDVVFNNATADQDVIINGYTRFYRIEIDKGNSQTYILNIDASAANLFYLYGYNNGLGSGDVTTVNNYLALGLLGGTVRLGNNITIPSLVEENGNGDLNYLIDEDACLWIDGADVTHTSHTYGTSNSLVIYGKLKVSNPLGSFNVNNQHGIILRRSAAIEVEDGTLIAPCIRTSTAAGTHRGSYLQSGGTVEITGNTTGANRHASVSMTFPDMSFKMSGGTLQIDEATNGGEGYEFSIVVGANAQNVLVTGGNIILIADNRDANFATTAPFYNLIIDDASGGTYSTMNKDFNSTAGDARSVSARELIVQNDLTILNTATYDANDIDVTVASDFTINTNATYIPGANSTSFNGTAGQTFQIDGTISGGLNNLSVANTSNTSISNDIDVLGNLSIASGCFLNDMGFAINLSGNVDNEGSHTSQALGGIYLSGTTDQLITGDGNGVFGNLLIDKASGNASLAAAISLTGNLRLASGILDANVNNINLGPTSNIYDALTGTSAVFSGTKMIQTAGNPSDGGLSKTFNATGSFTFPVGTSTDYTPAEITINIAPASWGTVSINPVSTGSPFATSANVLDYYWNVGSEDFTGIVANSITHKFTYVNSDISGTEANYIPGYYTPFNWNYINDISKVVDASNQVSFENINSIEGNYTAGEVDAFQTVTAYYSRKSGNWNDPNTWSTVSVGGPVDGGIPGIGNAAIIGDTLGNSHTVTIPAGLDNLTVGGLEIANGSTLDITSTIGHNFGFIPFSEVKGTGTLRISSNAVTATFPGGDFGNFLSENGGTVEYYSTGTTDFTLPSDQNQYYNLIISPAAGRTITMPDLDITMYNDLSISGAGQANLNSGSSTLLNANNININIGSLIFVNTPGGLTQTITVLNDVNIGNGASIEVQTANNGSHELYVYGNIVNNGTLDLYGGNTSRVCDLYFVGDEDKVFSGTGTNDINYLNIDKGNSRNTILDVTSDNLSLNGTGTALVLSNGTFRISNAALNFTLSTNSNFYIPSTTAVSVTDGTINIGTNSDDGDLILLGRLEVLNNGIVNIGNGTGYNNDIEYASGGDPEIFVGGSGVLNVEGQIRRNNTITTGALIYNQSGGTVTVKGENQNTQRAKLEILNPGSKFTMSGGTLIFENGGGDDNSFGDILLTPEISNVTGGTIQVGSTNSTDTDFLLNADCPIWNLTIDATTSTKTLDLRINDLDLENNLTINGNSVFKANGFDVNIGGSLTNNNTDNGTGENTGGYQVGSTTQTTTFDGSSAMGISGVSGNISNFSNLIFSGSGNTTLTANTELRINTNLSILSATLNDGGNDIVVIGDVTNSAIHSSSLVSGGLIFKGSDVQELDGDGVGVFGNVEIDNGSGVEFNDNFIINGELEFTTGNLYIDDYNLTLGLNATIAGTTDEDHMIVLNGVISDYGVTKVFPSGIYSFEYPVGVFGKYTPVSYSFTANGNSNATITVKPINSSHPSLDNAAGDELNFYWNIISSGLSGIYDVDHSYTYIQNDVNGTETNYYTGRFFNAAWVPQGGISGTVNDATDQISLSNVSYIDGEYTAGETANYGVIQTLYSITSGDWSDGNTWSTTGHSGGACGCTPNGNPVVISSDHTIDMDVDNAVSYSIELNGTLDVGTTLFHSIGHIDGDGTLKLSATTDGVFVFPGGNYENFLANTGSTIEFFGDVDATLPLKPGNNYKPYQNVIFSGTGSKKISAEDLKVLGDLVIEDGSTLDNTEFDRTLTINGDWTDNSTSVNGGFLPGEGSVVFNGTALQTITITDAAVTSQFYDLEIDNSAGLTLAGSGSIGISNDLYLTLGNINTSSTNILSISNTNPNAVIGAGSTSYVNGPMVKSIGLDSYFDFPVGDDGNGGRFGNALLSSVSVAGDYTVQYFDHNPDNEGYDPTSVVLPIDVVSNVEYWAINGPGGAISDLQVRWDSQSSIIPAGASSRAKLRLVEWNGSAWELKGNVIDDGGVNSGTVETGSATSVAGDHYFTLGVESLPIATITSSDASICDDGSTTNITIDLTGTAPWTIRYKINGTNETTVSNIATSPYTLVVSNALTALDIGGPDDYDFNVSYISDATGSTGIQDFTSTVTITLNEVPEPVISGNTTVAIGETVTYSTPNVSGHTYQWTVNNGTINGSSTNNSVSITWASSFGTGWVKVEETATTGGCSTTTTNYDINITDVPNPTISGDDEVCLNETVTYRTPIVGSHTYTWTLPLGGGNIIGSSNLDSVIVNWTGEGTFSVSVSETGSSTVSNTLNVNVNPIPNNSNVVTDPTSCEGSNAIIVVESAAPGIMYQLRLNSDDTEMGAPVSSGPGGDVELNDNPSINTVYNVFATNEYSCSIQLTDISSVTVQDKPTVNAGIDQDACSNNTSVTLNGNITNASGGTWTGGSGSFTPDENALNASYVPTLSEISTGSIALVLTTTGNGVCNAVTDTMEIQYNTAPVANVTITDNSGTTNNDAVFCSGDSVIITGPLGLNYNWSTTENSQEIVVKSTGNYTLIVTDANSCTDTTEVTATVQSLPIGLLTINDADSIICENALVGFTATNGSNYNFMIDGSTVQNTNSATFEDNSILIGNYTMTVEVTDNNNCVNTYNAIDFEITAVPKTDSIYHKPNH